MSSPEDARGRPERASGAAIDQALNDLPGWFREGNELRCRYRLPRFIDAVEFTNRMAQLAERLQHHPEWKVAYRQVDVATTTHDADGLTALDLELAAGLVVLAVEMDAEVLSNG